MDAVASRALVVGVDFGTLSGRAVVVRVSAGAELGTAVHEYRHATNHRAFTNELRWNQAYHRISSSPF